mmetsp:Transcript_26803/g.70442  ORF Transcript_26803/g.70442 Transcript_26803/m.70442 type:complete len:213 (+) Transcript_26803:588-1226(+)
MVDTKNIFEEFPAPAEIVSAHSPLDASIFVIVNTPLPINVQHHRRRALAQTWRARSVLEFPRGARDLVLRSPAPLSRAWRWAAREGNCSETVTQLVVDSRWQITVGAPWWSLQRVVLVGHRAPTRAEHVLHHVRIPGLHGRRGNPAPVRGDAVQPLASIGHQTRTRPLSVHGHAVAGGHGPTSRRAGHRGHRHPGHRKKRPPERTRDPWWTT